MVVLLALLVGFSGVVEGLGNDDDLFCFPVILLASSLWVYRATQPIGGGGGWRGGGCGVVGGGAAIRSCLWCWFPPSGCIGLPGPWVVVVGVALDVYRLY